MAQISTFDRTLKILARNHADLFLRLAFPAVEARLVGTLENVELSLPVKPVDFVHRIVHDGQEYLFHLEFQLVHDPDLPRRVCAYYGMLTEQFKLPVVTLVLYLRPRQAPVPAAYVVRLGAQEINRFSYPVLKLWDYASQIRSGQLRALAPLLVTLVEDPQPAVLAEERALILAEPDAQRRADLLALAVTLGAPYFEPAFLWRFFREEVEQMRTATFIDEWLQESLEKGFQQGTQQGTRQGLHQGLLAGIKLGLKLRFGSAGLRLWPEIAKIEDVDVLQTVQDALETVSTPDELRQIYA